MTARILFVLCCTALIGCGTAQPPAPAPTGPSYAEALTIYNQELALLEQLKTSARQTTAAHEEKLSRLKSSLALGDAVKDLQVLNDLAIGENLLNDEDAAKAKAAGEKARNQLGEAGAKAAGEIEKIVKEYEAQMAELKQSIAEQEAKVAKALEMKDAAEKRKQRGMGTILSHSPAMLIVAAFSRYDEALDWARETIAARWSAIGLESLRFDFKETDYYQPTMGPGLKKTFFAGRELIDPARLKELKLAANAWEEEYARLGRHAEQRPLNLDPGYLTLAKLVLASTKDHAHRIYLADGIYAEVTLSYQDRRWQHRPWTFPDYRREDYQQFFTQCRQRLKG